MITEKQKNKICDMIEDEGLDYIFRFKSSFPEVKDKKFHKLREEYRDAAAALTSYIGLDEAD